MADVRMKICRDCDIGEPEMLELLVAEKIVGMNLAINSVYEQIWWPFVYKKHHPDSYEVPEIDKALAEGSTLSNMIVVFRLAGMDGEATEDRIESLADSLEPTDDKEIEKKYALAKVISRQLGQSTGVSVLLETFD